MKVDLIVPPISEETLPVSRCGFFPPLGLLSIAEYAHQRVPDLDVRVVDGNMHPESEIGIRRDANVVGFSPTVLSYDSCLRLAQKAKNNGSIVVFGGPYAGALPERISKARAFVDYVVSGDGEVPFAQLLEGKDAAAIPGLTYRSDGDVLTNPTFPWSLDEYPYADRALVDRQAYLDRFRVKYERLGYSVPDLICSQKDCLWSSRTGGCVFCSRSHAGYRSRSPEAVWEEISWLHQTYGTDYIWDVSGSFIGNREWFGTFHGIRPRETPVTLEVYGRAAEVTPKVAEMMYQVGVRKVFIGAESGDMQVLRDSGKCTTPEANLRAVTLCAERGISLSLGIVVGLPGESESSIRQTLSHLRQLVSIGDVETISCAVLLPVPGSRAFTMLSEHPATGGKYEHGDHWNLQEMQEDWLSHFTSIHYDYAQQVAETILSYAPTQSALMRPRRAEV